jgi:hypothetical protein
LIPKVHILEWASKTPWPEEQQVEQDLGCSVKQTFSEAFAMSQECQQRKLCLHELPKAKAPAVVFGTAAR